MFVSFTRRALCTAAAIALLIVARASAAHADLNGRWVRLAPLPVDPPPNSGHAAALFTWPGSSSAGMLVCGGRAVSRDWIRLLALGDTPGWEWEQPGEGAPPVDPVVGATFVDQYPMTSWTRVGGSPLSPRFDTFFLYFAPFRAQKESYWSFGSSVPADLIRVGHAACAPPSSLSMYVFGGRGSRAGEPPDSLRPLDDLWHRDFQGWRPLAPTGPHPAARSGHTMVYDSHRDRLLVFGGDTLASGVRVCLGDTWAFSLDDSAWTLLDSAGPARGEHLAFYDPYYDRLVILFGRDANGRAQGDAWQLWLGGSSQWSRLSPVGSGPPARSASAGVFDPASGRFALYGGLDANGGDLGDTWLLDFDHSLRPTVTCSMPTTAFPGQRVRFRGVGAGRARDRGERPESLGRHAEPAHRAAGRRPRDAGRAGCERPAGGDARRERARRGAPPRRAPRAGARRGVFRAVAPGRRDEAGARLPVALNGAARRA